MTTSLFDDVQDRAESQRRAEIGQANAAGANKAAVALIGHAFLDHLRDISPRAGSLDSLRSTGFCLPPMTSSNAIGAAIGALSRAGLIRCVGFTRADRIGAHRAKIFTWRLTDEVPVEGRGQ